MSTVASVLAAGASRRLGTPKQLLRLPDGRTLLQRSVDVLRASRALRCSVILGEHSAQVEGSLDGALVDFVPSEDATEGMAASIRAAVGWARRWSADALLLCVCDQPSLSTAHLDRLIDAASENLILSASFYEGKRGVPAVFPSSYFDTLCALRGDVGAARILKSASNVVNVDYPEGARDIDTPEDWQRAQRLLGKR